MGVLLLVRHGQASFGADDYDDLSDLGRHQARLLGARLRDQPVARLVSGGMRRQRDTATELGLGLNVEVDPRLDEYDHVSLLDAFAASGRTTDGDPQTVLEAALDWWAAGGVGGQERHPEFVHRVQDVLGELTVLPGLTVVVTSGGVVSVAAEGWLRMPPGTWPLLARVLVNAGVTKVATGRSGTSVLTLNDHAHLESDRALITYR